jgi:hypothetical protein
VVSTMSDVTQSVKEKIAFDKLLEDKILEGNLVARLIWPIRDSIATVETVGLSYCDCGPRLIVTYIDGTKQSWTEKELADVQ